MACANTLAPSWQSAADDRNWIADKEAKAAFLKLLDRPKVPLDVQTIETAVDGDFLRELLTFAVEKKRDGSIERVPTTIMRPASLKGKLPAVIVLHGTGRSKDTRTVMDFMRALANRGIMGLAIDARYHGGRIRGRGAAIYEQAITQAWLTPKGAPMEYPLYYDTCWDLWRLVDYLETRDDVGKLGTIGFSMGGIQTWLAAAVDERISVSVPALAVQSFRRSLENDQWQGRASTFSQAHAQAACDLGEPMVNQRVCRALWKKIVPGILDQHDCPNMLRLFAGSSGARPLLILGGTKDENCPYDGAKIAIASAQHAFQKVKAEDRLRVFFEDVGHTVTSAQLVAALDWFERWLK